MTGDKRSLRSLAKTSDNDISFDQVEEENDRLREMLEMRDRDIEEQRNKISELEEEVRFLKLPYAAQKKMRSSQRRERSAKLKELRVDLENTKRFKPFAMLSSCLSNGSSSSTPKTFMTQEYLSKFAMLEEPMSRETINWSAGNTKCDQEIFRRSLGHINSLQDILKAEQADSVYSEEIDIETKSYRLKTIDSDSDDDQESEEDLSDLAFLKRHQKLENREQLIVRKDKLAQRQQIQNDQDQKPSPLLIPLLYSAKDIETVEMEKGRHDLSVFGKLVPAIHTDEFKLPWITTKDELRREKSAKRKSTNGL